MVTVCRVSVSVTYLGSGGNESVVARRARDSRLPSLVRLGPTNARRVKVSVSTSRSQHCAKAHGGCETTACQVDTSRLCGVTSLQYRNTTRLTCALDAGETRAKPTRAGGGVSTVEALIESFPRREPIIFI